LSVAECEWVGAIRTWVTNLAQDMGGARVGWVARL
jgi:hypothetical protein